MYGSSDRGSEAEDRQEVDPYDAEFEKEIVEFDFLDAICDGLVVLGKDLKIVSQNFLSKQKMGNLIGQDCYRAMENSCYPCSHCPLQKKPDGDFEVSMRRSGESLERWYTVKISPIMDYDGSVIGVSETYPDMIDRRSILGDLRSFEEELSILDSAVDSIVRAVDIDELVNGTPGHAKSA